jgi:hypothetical protein
MIVVICDGDAVPTVVANGISPLIPNVGAEAPQIFAALPPFLKFGAVTVKSDELLSVSVHPLLFLMAAVVVESVDVAEVSEQLAVP